MNLSSVKLSLPSLVSHNLVSLSLVLLSLVGSNSAYAKLAPYQTKLPQLNATEFAPGIISTKSFEINTVLNAAGDEVIFSRCSDDFSHCTLMSSKFESDSWQSPKKLPFSGDFSDADPFYNNDYSILYYISKRPINNESEKTETYNLWRVSRRGNEWNEPEYLSGLSSDKHDLYPSLTDDGTLFFTSFRNEQQQLYFVKSTMGKFGDIQPMPAHIYGENGRIGDSAVSKDGKTIFFSISNRADSKGRGDLYFSRKVNGKWGVAESLGEKVNTASHEFTPILSPDNKKLYFTRIEDGKGNLYGIDLSALNISLEMDESGQLDYRQKALNAAENDKTLAGIPLDKPWKKSIYLLSANTMQHPAWGMNHSERNYLLVQNIAKKEQVNIDDDVLFAAAFLHDMATFSPWSNGTDHSVRAAELVPAILRDFQFDESKIESVQGLILGHMFSAKATTDPLERFFHDADTLDFLGVTGITRILSLNGKGAWATNTAKAISTLQGFAKQLPETLLSETAKNIGEKELHDMQEFLKVLEKDTHQFKAP